MEVLEKIKELESLVEVEGGSTASGLQHAYKKYRSLNSSEYRQASDELAAQKLQVAVKSGNWLVNSKTGGLVPVPPRRPDPTAPDQTGALPLSLDENLRALADRTFSNPWAADFDTDNTTAFLQGALNGIDAQELKVPGEAPHPGLFGNIYPVPNSEQMVPGAPFPGLQKAPPSQPSNSNPSLIQPTEPASIKTPGERSFRGLHLQDEDTARNSTDHADGEFNFSMDDGIEVASADPYAGFRLLAERGLSEKYGYDTSAPGAGWTPFPGHITKEAVGLGRDIAAELRQAQADAALASVEAERKRLAATRTRPTIAAGGFTNSDRVSRDPNNEATYGRKQSDGSVTGTTSGGSRYRSSNGGGSISVTDKSGKTRTYVRNRRRGYSLKL